MKLKFTLPFVALLLSVPTVQAQTNMSARETATKIAERILSSTTYLFENKKTGETYWLRSFKIELFFSFYVVISPALHINPSRALRNTVKD